MASSTIADAALDYAKRGWKPVPVSRKTKKAIGKDWQKHPFNPAQFNGDGQNVGIQFGADSGGLCDVDLDSTLAIGFAPEFLPPTDAIFGRRSKPCSHQLYVSDLHNSEAKAVLQFPEYVGGRPGPMIVELRIGANGKGAVTVFPPSMHVTGEMVQWTSDGEPAHVAGVELKRAVAKLAVACLLKRHYPEQGSRHQGALVIGGVLARAGWPGDDIRHVIEIVARAAGDDDVHDRAESAANAVGLKADGGNVPGRTRLGEAWGQDVADTLGKWLDLRALRQGQSQGQGQGAGLEDSVALAFAEQHAEHYRYVAKSSQWMGWGGAHWAAEDTLATFDASRTLCRSAGDARAKTVAAVVTLARADRRVAATTEQWDANSWLFNAGDQQGG
jgi:Bifunctional DNA primase/polymerase, N-terminal